MSEAVLRPLTAPEAELYEFMSDGGTRSQFATKRGVTKAAITQMVASLMRKGYSVPDPLPKESPRYDLAKTLMAQGLNNKELAAKMEISFSLACFYRRKLKAEA
jgi:DNA-binding NarL/FixJ family response regulator